MQARARDPRKKKETMNRHCKAITPGPNQLAAEAEWARGGDEQWRKLGIAAEPDPIRLNRQYVLQWDPIFESPNSRTGDPLRRHHVAAVTEPKTERVLDWAGFADKLHLSPDEKEVFLLHWVDGRPMANVHRELGIKKHAAAKLYGSVKRKLGMPNTKTIAAQFVILVPSGSSLVTSYRERQISGGREGPWSLSEPGPPEYYPCFASILDKADTKRIC
jgi:hypothetical protein